MQALRTLKLKDSGKNIDLANEIGTDYKKIGRILLENHKKVANIEANNRGQTEDIVDAILIEWLKGGGRTPVTWETLIAVLRECGLVTLADDVNNAIGYGRQGWFVLLVWLHVI